MVWERFPMACLGIILDEFWSYHTTCGSNQFDSGKYSSMVCWFQSMPIGRLLGCCFEQGNSPGTLTQCSVISSFLTGISCLGPLLSLLSSNVPGEYDLIGRLSRFESMNVHSKSNSRLGLTPSYLCIWMLMMKENTRIHLLSHFCRPKNNTRIIGKKECRVNSSCLILCWIDSPT